MLPLFYGVVLKLFGKHELALLACFLMAFSTWHIRSSRLGLEMIWALFFQLLGVYLFLSARPFKLKRLLLGLIAFSLSMFSYQSAKMTTPILIAGLIYLYFFRSLTRRQFLQIVSLSLVFVLIPIIVYFLIRPIGEMRVVGISIFTLWHAQIMESHVSLFSFTALSQLGKMIAQNYLEHFNPGLLFFDNSQLRYYYLDQLGLLYPWQIFFIIFGLHSLIKNIKSPKYAFLLMWIICAPLPAALTNSPTSNIGRALLLFPALEIVTGIGLLNAISFLRNQKKHMLTIGLSVIVISAGIGLYQFLDAYYNQMPIKYAQNWGTPLKEALPFIISQENNYQKIIISNSIRQPYMYFLFYGNKTPIWLSTQEKRRDSIVGYSQIANYEFRPINWKEDKLLKNALLVGSPEEIPAQIPSIYEYKEPILQRVLLRMVKT